MGPFFWPLIISILIICITVYAAVMAGGKSDDNRRWNNLLLEMAERYPTANYRAQLEFLRRDKYVAIRETTQKHEDIGELTEEYQLILDEQERIDEGERQLGAEFQPHVANQTAERN